MKFFLSAMYSIPIYLFGMSVSNTFLCGALCGIVCMAIDRAVAERSAA
jgi:hypothetical protein